MKKVIFSILALSLSLAVSAQQSWSNDPMHSRLGFVVKHLTISEINGQFNDFSIKVKASKADFSDMKVNLTAKTASINTGVEMRDNHLKTDNFFDVQKYPELTFESTSMNKISDKNFTLTGNLTMHGVTKLVTLNVLYFGTVVNPMNKKNVFGFHITSSVKRSDFAIGPNFPEQLVSDEIQIVADAEFSNN
jgi:polyisoprenoid-binding protein YceI